MNERPVIVLREGHKRFGGVIALARVSLTIMPGTFTALVGPNGCGKTTLFNVISGHVTLDGGQLQLNGRLVSGAEAAALARDGVARTFQEGRVWSGMSVLDNIVLGMRGRKSLSWRSRKADDGERPAAMRLMEEVGLVPDLAGYPAGVLPLVERRRVELARALAGEPSLVLVDEIAAGLNSGESSALFQRLAEARSARPALAIIAIEHKIDLLLGFSDRVVFMNDGNIVFDAPAGLVRGDPALLAQYWAPVRRTRTDARQ